MAGGSGGGLSGECWPQAEACYVAGPSGPGAECLSKADNSGKTTWTGRLTSIHIQKPTTLAQKLIQESVIDKGVDLNQSDCNERGEGTFTWLLELDSTSGKLKTGGGLPIGDPKAGSCFVSLPNAALPVAPISVDIALDGNQFSASGIDVNVPIFADPNDLSNVIILPLHAVDFTGSFNDDTHNCIGKYNGDSLSLDNLCYPDTTTTPPQRTWTTGGTLKGHITVAEADKVMIDDLGATLCAFIGGTTTWKGPDGSCATSAEGMSGKLPDGDWCAATNAAADANCKDAWRLEGAFAAAAFPISGDCPP